jgi:hypothetical protein
LPCAHLQSDSGDGYPGSVKYQALGLGVRPNSFVSWDCSWACIPVYSEPGLNLGCCLPDKLISPLKPAAALRPETAPLQSTMHLNLNRPSQPTCQNLQPLQATCTYARTHRHQAARKQSSSNHSASALPEEHCAAEARHLPGSASARLQACLSARAHVHTLTHQQPSHACHRQRRAEQLA